MIKLIIGVAKYIIFVFNFIFVILGSLLILFGLLPIVNGGYDSAYSKIAIAAGALVFVVAFFGCCGAVRENKTLLTAHAVIFIILFVVQMVAVLVMIAIDANGYDGIDNKLNQYIYSKYTNEVNLMKEIEKWLSCCGIHNSTDYTDRGLPLPGACCGESDDLDSHNEWTCTPGIAYRYGCSQKLKDYIEDNFKYVMCIAIGLAIFEIFGAIFTLWTRNHLIPKVGPKKETMPYPKAIPHQEDIVIPIQETSPNKEAVLNDIAIQNEEAIPSEEAISNPETISNGEVNPYQDVISSEEAVSNEEAISNPETISNGGVNPYQDVMSSEEVVPNEEALPSEKAIPNQETISNEDVIPYQDVIASEEAISNQEATAPEST